VIRDRQNEEDHAMDTTWIIAIIRAEETVRATSPAAVLARMECEHYDDYIVVRQHRPEPLDSDTLSLCDFWLAYTRDVAYMRSHLRASAIALVVALALLVPGRAAAAPDAAAVDWSAEFPTAAAGALTPADFADPLQPDAARSMVAALSAEQAVDQLLYTRAGQRLINSALLCQATELLTAPGPSAATARRRLAVIGVAATDRLERQRITPLACDAWPVARLIACLGLLPGPECSTDAELVTQVSAAERLAVQP
jgi:hypothetical protein